jgi:hypothetical protein
MARTVFVVAGSILILSMVLGAQPNDRHFPLESVTGLRPHNVTAEPATHVGRKGLQVAMTDAAVERLKAMTPAERDRATEVGGTVEQLALLEGTVFGNG